MKQIYEIERVIKQTNEPFYDGTHIVYVNGEYRGDNPIGMLMHDFSCTKPDDMKYEVLAKRARYFKEEKEGVGIMCKAMEEMRNEAMQLGMEAGMEESNKKTIDRMLERGKYSLEEIADCTGLTVEKVKEIAEQKKED